MGHGKVGSWEGRVMGIQFLSEFKADSNLAQLPYENKQTFKGTYELSRTSLGTS